MRKVYLNLKDKLFTKIHQDFKTFTPEEYLNEYYHSVFSENNELLKFYARVAKEVGQGSTLLEFGGGPTIYQLISLAPKLSTIHFGDFLEENIGAVKKWLDKIEGAHDWTNFISVALSHELGREPTQSEITDREELVRGLIHHFGHVDAFNPRNDKMLHEKYDVVASNFVAESIASNRDEWEKALRNITRYTKEDGLLCITAIRNAPYWLSGGKHYTAFPVNRQEVLSTLEKNGFIAEYIKEIDAFITDPTSKDYEGYDGMIFVLARRK